MHRVFAAATAALLALTYPQLASAQNLKKRLVGAWTLAEGSEIMPDGKKVVPWEKGSLIVDPSGHLSFFVVAKNRDKTDSPRKPAGPLVAYYGTYTVDGNNKFTIKITGSASPAFEGATREQTVSFQGDKMTVTGSKVQTPEGAITPVNVWQRAK
jgi:hypothetical protein